jgi:hypothetical protein
VSRVDRYGEWAQRRDVTGMLVPVLCRRCGQVYDLCKGEPVEGGRYLDCTVYITPCCRQKVDDRTWVSSPAFDKLDRDGRAFR